MRRIGSLLVAVAVAACAHPAPAPERTGADRIVWVEGAAGRLRVSDGGAGEPPVVLVHGLGSDLDAWSAQLAHLRATRRAVAYDQRGHGRSDRARDGVYTIDALAADLDAVARALGLQRFVLVGHSMGGAVVTAYAAAHPEKVIGVVYADGVADLSGYPREEVDAELAKLAAHATAADRRATFEEMLAPARPETRARVLASLERIDPPAFVALYRSLAAFAARERFARYRGPAVAIEVAESRDPSLASIVLGIPRVDLPGVSHWLMMDDPEGFDRALDAFVGFKEGSGPAPRGRSTGARPARSRAAPARGG